MIYIKTYEGILDFFKKKQPDPYYDKIEYPTIDSYWKFSFLVKHFNKDDNLSVGDSVTLVSEDVKCVIKCEKNYSDIHTDIFVFDGVWLDSYEIKNLYSFQHGTYPNYLQREIIGDINAGDSFKKNIEIEKENWNLYYKSGLTNNPFISVIKATTEEIEFFDFYQTTKKYNL